MKLEFLQKFLGAVLGKVIGVRLGIPFEFRKTSAEIQTEFPYVQTYAQDGNVTYPDDDTTGFVMFAKCFEEISSLDELTPEIVAEVILNYASENRGFFWWGENGTERFSYHQLLNGVSPLESGDYAHIGSVADCIGGQIFYECCGLIFAGNPENAVKSAGILSRVMHNGEGALGGEFIAGCISSAFIENDIEKVVQTALSLLPPKSHYAKMVNNIIYTYHKNPYDWHYCMHYIDTYYNEHDVWDYGAHVVMSLLYGKGNFGYSMQICLQSAGDTDCNCANVGTIMGAFCGYYGISYDNWVEPLHDRFYISSAVPYENDVSITRFTAKLITLYAKFHGETVPDYIREASEENNFSFAFPCSYQGMEAIMWRNGTERSDLISKKNSLWISSGEVTAPSGSPYTLKFWAHYVKAGDCMRIFRWFDGERDFGDYRVYEPTSCTRIFGGQTISTKLFTRYNNCNMHIRLMAYSTIKDIEAYSEEITLKPYEWTDISFTLPDVGYHFDCLNIEIVPEKDSYFENGYDGLDLYVDTIRISGTPQYKISFALNRHATDNRYHYPVMKNFNICYGEANWKHNGSLHLYAGYKHRYQETSEKKGFAMAVTGAYMQNYIAKCKISILTDEENDFDKYHSSALMLVGVQGNIRHYAVGFHNGKIAILKSGSLPAEYTVITSADYDYDPHKKYRFRVAVSECGIHFTVTEENGSHKKIIQAEAPCVIRGCIGFASLKSGITVYSYSVK